MFHLSRKEDIFFDYFISLAQTINESAGMFKQYIEHLEDAETRYNGIKDLEHKCDDQIHTLLENLNQSFITPIDREDIYLIAKEMDDIIDFIEETASRFIMFNIKETTKEACQFANMIEASTKELIVLMKEFKDMKRSKNLPEKIIEINRIENEGDTAFKVAIKGLFNSNLPTLEVLKWKEVYECLENALDACEEVANTVEGVVMKHA